MSRAGQELIALRSADGATAEISRHGGHVVSWRPATDGDERLFLSGKSDFSPHSAIRGGVPVIFPQFAAEGPLPRHGFARTSEWTLTSAERTADGTALASLVLRDTPATREIWPAPFVLTIAVLIGGSAITMGLGVLNTGAAPLTFTAALHTYLRVRDVAEVELIGLAGSRYRESSAPTHFHTDEAPAIQPIREIDRVYVDAPHSLILREPHRALHIEKTGFRDVVIWNPGAAAAAKLADMEPGGERRMLCVEAAAVQTPVVLAPGERWHGEQRLVAR